MKVHFIGIGGIGLSALARFLNHDGHEVSGSDMKSSPITKELEKEGIKVSCPQAALNINDDFDLVIYSAAVTDENPELMESRLKQIRTLSRKEALPIILGDKKNYCVAGAHGKSTTTAILASILESSALIGAISKDFGSNFRYVNDLVAFEADESDASFLLSNPYCSIVTNAEPEHMEYYNYDYDKFFQAYETFINLGEKIVINAEDEYLKKLKINESAVKLYPSKDIKNITYILIDNQPHTRFELLDLGFFDVWGFGYHIAVDASLAIMAALNELDIETIRKNILNYKGIKKRFDIVQGNNDFVVIDDYAHHPTEISATLDAVKRKYKDRRVVAVFKPNTYSRTKDFTNEFVTALSKADKVYLTEIDCNRERQSDYPGVTSNLIVEKIKGAEIISEDTIDKLKNEKDSVVCFMSCAYVNHLIDAFKEIIK